MDGAFEFLVCLALLPIAAIASLTIHLTAAERRLVWQVTAITVAFAMLFFGIAREVDESRIYWFSTTTFYLLSIGIGWAVGAVVGWVLRFGRDQL